MGKFYKRGSASSHTQCRALHPTSTPPPLNFLSGPFGSGRAATARRQSWTRLVTSVPNRRQASMSNKGGAGWREGERAGC